MSETAGLVPALELDPGTRFMWCDRVVTAERCQRFRGPWRSKDYVRVWITVDGQERGLHYWSTEYIPLAP